MTKVLDGEVTIKVNRLKAARLSAGLTLRELAAKAGISNSSSVWRAEAGYEPNLKTALKLAKALEHPVEELWEI